ncbi:hypothetical protein [Alienimonas sp. DA493]|uniref:hypothetical protein n=1 Tax=Alienimonas sp. DA493 TaxID=3373605 RepID=UPI00375408E8
MKFDTDDRRVLWRVALIGAGYVVTYLCSMGLTAGVLWLSEVPDWAWRCWKVCYAVAPVLMLLAAGLAAGVLWRQQRPARPPRPARRP